MKLHKWGTICLVVGILILLLGTGLLMASVRFGFELILLSIVLNVAGISMKVVR